MLILLKDKRFTETRFPKLEWLHFCAINGLKASAERLLKYHNVNPHVELFKNDNTAFLKALNERNLDITKVIAENTYSATGVTFSLEEKNKFLSLLDGALVSLKEQIEIPDHFLCPITHEIMCDPVKNIQSKDGKNYERQAINEWLRRKGTCPLARTPLKMDDFVSNDKLQSQIVAWLEEHYLSLDVQSLRARFPDSKEILKISNAGETKINKLEKSLLARCPSQWMRNDKETYIAEIIGCLKSSWELEPNPHAYIKPAVE